MVCPPLARFLPPLERPGRRTTDKVIIRHPDYKPPNILLAFPAVDSVEPSILGLHHQTALTASAIIVNNAFDQVYLTDDQSGNRPVTTSCDGVLEPGDYWLHLRGRELDTDVSSNIASIAADCSMPPPPTLRSSTSIHASSASASTTHPYPIVPCFQDWQFPHGGLPAEWKLPHTPPPSQGNISLPSASQPISDETTHCYLTDVRMGSHKCHLVPKEEQKWFERNEMASHSSNRKSMPSLGYTDNLITLQANFHQLFDNGRFVFVPKPSTALPSLEPTTSKSPLTSTADPRPHAIVAHVLNLDEDGVLFFDLYHNTAIQTNFSGGFLSFPRWVTIPIDSDDEDTSDVSQDNLSNNPPTKVVKMTSGQVDQRRKQHKSAGKSNKRLRSQDPQDGEINSNDDLYERWKRRCASMDSDELDIARWALDENTRWWEEVGRFAGAEDENADIESEAGDAEDEEVDVEDLDRG
ncbi:hypothetical protein O1611_g49 [Lasiodiplodia mahajangana]|uniref:Uncharacterized protein n=1 Tax=Lasiodiplodia mahajangana TaxID=1108764 RepID=A0ACC2K1H8_9PEZI|nr:hypothetical protein O1611_g49 [Lasiodiplodia mahajangana]